MIYQKIKVVGWKHKSKCSPSSTCHTTFTFNPKLSQNQTITHPGLYSHLLKPDIYSSTLFYKTHSFSAYHISAALHSRGYQFCSLTWQTIWLQDKLFKLPLHFHFCTYHTHICMATPTKTPQLQPLHWFSVQPLIITLHNIIKTKLCGKGYMPDN